MDIYTVILLCIFAAIILINIFVCYRVVKSDFFEPRQKIIQCILIWLLPLVGALVAYAFTRGPKISHTRGYPGNSSDDPGGVGITSGLGDYFGGGHHGD